MRAPGAEALGRRGAGRPAAGRCNCLYRRRPADQELRKAAPLAGATGVQAVLTGEEQAHRMPIQIAEASLPPQPRLVDGLLVEADPVGLQLLHPLVEVVALEVDQRGGRWHKPVHEFERERGVAVRADEPAVGLIRNDLA